MTQKENLKMTTKWHETRKHPEASFSEILIPCKTCSNESISVGNGYCRVCYMELITNAILNS